MYNINHPFWYYCNKIMKTKCKRIKPSYSNTNSWKLVTNFIEFSCKMRVDSLLMDVQ